MASLKTISIALLGLSFCAFAVQLGGLAAMADTGCRSPATSGTGTLPTLATYAAGGAFFSASSGLPAYSGFTSGTDPTRVNPSRRLLEAPSKFDLASRCNIGISLDWWAVTYQFGVIVFALFSAFTERMYQARVRVSILFAIAICWCAIQASVWLPNVVAYTNWLRDNEIFEQDAQPTNKAWVNFLSTRVYIAGHVLATIFYFFFIIFGLGEFKSA